MISLSKARFCDFSHRGYGNGFFWDWLVKLHDNSFQTLYSVGVEDFFEVRFQLIMLWIVSLEHELMTDGKICIFCWQFCFQWCHSIKCKSTSAKTFHVSRKRKRENNISNINLNVVIYSWYFLIIVWSWNLSLKITSDYFRFAMNIFWNVLIQNLNFQSVNLKISIEFILDHIFLAVHFFDEECNFAFKGFVFSYPISWLGTR